MKDKEMIEYIDKKQKLEKINIKMFEKAQKYLKHEFVIVDRVYIKEKKKDGILTKILKKEPTDTECTFFYVNFMKIGFWELCYSKEDLIWKPSQKQLRNIASKTWMQFDMDCLTLWFDLATYSKTKQDLTKETIGLRIVMKKKFKMIWNGEDWKEAI